MSRRIKLLLLALLSIVGLIGAFCINTLLGVIVSIVGCVVLFSSACFIVCNILIRRTNWWKNQRGHITQFVSNAGYRDNIIRNYDVVNLGSNPAHYAFFYENVIGQSWATGSQGPDMDFEILKNYHSYIKEGGTVIIPIMPFSAISPFLKERPDYWGVSYYAKFYSILDGFQRAKLPYSNVIPKYLKFPLLFNKTAVLYLLQDAPLNATYQITEQPLMEMELMQDAKRWINLWTKEFVLRNLNDVFDDKWNKYYNEAVSTYKNMVDFCLERGLKPVFVCAPMTEYLSSLFPEDVRKHLVTEFVEKCNVKGCTFLDYTCDKRFMNPELYFNSFFLNMKGRKVFTQQVLKDLDIIK